MQRSLRRSCWPCPPPRAEHSSVDFQQAAVGSDELHETTPTTVCLSDDGVGFRFETEAAGSVWFLVRPETSCGVGDWDHAFVMEPCP